jgi:hypothetical protein
MPKVVSRAQARFLFAEAARGGDVSPKRVKEDIRKAGGMKALPEHVKVRKLRLRRKKAKEMEDGK